MLLCSRFILVIFSNDHHPLLLQAWRWSTAGIWCLLENIIKFFTMFLLGHRLIFFFYLSLSTSRRVLLIPTFQTGLPWPFLEVPCSLKKVRAILSETSESRKARSAGAEGEIKKLINFFCSWQEVLEKCGGKKKALLRYCDCTNFIISVDHHLILIWLHCTCL